MVVISIVVVVVTKDYATTAAADDDDEADTVFLIEIKIDQGVIEVDSSTKNSIRYCC